jgi:hypothetical protein
LAFLAFLPSWGLPLLLPAAFGGLPVKCSAHAELSRLCGACRTQFGKNFIPSKIYTTVTKKNPVFKKKFTRERSWSLKILPEIFMEHE